jgi:large subunit ribosomal protein L30
MAKKEAKKEETKKVRVTLTKSVITSKQTHKDTVRALGLRKMHQTVELYDTPSIRGMLAKVIHLITVEEVS